MSVGRGIIWKKQTTEEARSIDMLKFSKDVDLESHASGYTTWGSASGRGNSIGWQVDPPHRIRLYYSITKRLSGEKTDYDYWIDLDTTPCHFGGKRWWFICPNRNCGRRCRILYLASQSDYFLCRICQNLTYRIQQEGPSPFRKMMRAAVLEAYAKTARQGGTLGR